MKSKSLFRKKKITAILADAHAEAVKLGDVHGLRKTLTLKDLTSFGIAAIVGAGIFSTIGKASFDGGPAIVFLFVATAIACGLSALSYAEFASAIPISGSAYTYAYASFGELVAWIIGWDLLMEYAIGNIAVAISWSDYFSSFLAGFGLHLPHYLTMDYLSASRGFAQGVTDSPAYLAWTSAPMLGPLKVILDIPALAIVVFITYLAYVGIRETRNAANAMVGLKLAIISLVILVGAFYVNPANWSPFAPNGVRGVLSGVSAVFFAYIGFDAISTTAEECKNPQRDLPLSMFLSLIICTVIYIAIALVLTGTVPYTELNVGDPLAFVLSKLGLHWLSGVVALSAIVAMASVLLVFQMGQPRIWMSMSRDGLLPKKFAAIHPKYKTPAFATLVTGVVVAVPALFMNLTEVTDLTSIGTLFAFVLVNAGVLVIDNTHPENLARKRFKVPYINSKWIVPSLVGLGVFGLFVFNPDGLAAFFSMQTETAGESAWDVIKHKIPLFLFMFLTLLTAVASYLKNLSLLPVLGMLSCFYLMTELGYTNWLRFFIWLAVGLAVYFLYGYRHSRLNKG